MGPVGGMRDEEQSYGGEILTLYMKPPVEP